jgi:hypothetical protein
MQVLNVTSVPRMTTVAKAHVVHRRVPSDAMPTAAVMHTTADIAAGNSRGSRPLSTRRAGLESCDRTGWPHESGTYVKFGAELFALKGPAVAGQIAAAIPTRNESTPNGVESIGVH